MHLAKRKSDLRKIFKEKRAALSAQERHKKSQEISDNFIKNLLPNVQGNKKVFSLYLASENEVITDEIAEFFKKNNIKFCYPKIINSEQPLEFIAAEKNQKLVPNKFFPKIIEPHSGEKILPDIIIMPLLAFDPELSRLGMGGGFFDRTIEFLKKQKSEILTIGLAYEFQRSREILPTENTDQKLDFVVTEKIIFPRS